MPFNWLKRREFIALVGGAVAGWPVAARAQKADRVRRIGVFTGFDENNPEGKRRLSAFIQALAGLGWTDGRNVRIDLRWGDDINRIPVIAQELVGQRPDIIVTDTTVATAALQRETRTIPIVFATLNTPTIRRLNPSRRHQLSPIAPLQLGGSTPRDLAISMLRALADEGKA